MRLVHYSLAASLVAAVLIALSHDLQMWGDLYHTKGVVTTVVALWVLCSALATGEEAKS